MANWIWLEGQIYHINCRTTLGANLRLMARMSEPVNGLRIGFVLLRVGGGRGRTSSNVFKTKRVIEKNGIGDGNK